MTYAKFALVSFFALSAALTSTGHASNIATSVYSDLSEANCNTLVEESEEYVRFKCSKSVPGYELFVVSFDARDTLAFKTAQSGIDYSLDLFPVTNGAFNSIGQKLEWRGTFQNGRFVPFAAIVRVFVAKPAENGDWTYAQKLAVFKITKKEACVIGHVNADKYADANVRARALADTSATNANCE